MLDAAVQSQSSDASARLLDSGLATARATRGLTFVVLPAPVVAPAAIIAAWRGAPIAAWSARELQLVGIGVARELRGSGTLRFDEVVAQARAIEVGAMTGTWTPRLLGGAAFAPGAADAAPWTGFGDAWFALPRWTYASGQLVLAVDANDARHAGRWRLGSLRSAHSATPSGSSAC